ncbi:GNAT family N-acetyltransferase [Arachnia propionica]|uniref:N-acetyltransferase n=1 Tax=Arachnia propionica TaxID=1750 RepID=A0A3P1WM13_9ACTN|nr:GNAT family protein [Arachnia propionica]RRD47584.1 N-acetyltransferase [Arachnia propionica]
MDPLATAFPPFGLRIRHDDMTLRLMRDEDFPEYLDLVSRPIFPDEQVEWIFPWYEVPAPERRRNAAQAHWRFRAEFSPASWVLGFGVWVDDVLVGCQDVTATQFAERRVVGSGSWLALEHQGKGWGSRMRQLMLHFAFDHLGARRAESAAVIGNEASMGVSRSAGYRPNGIRTEVHGSRTVEVQYVSVTPEQFNRLDGEVVVEGFTDDLRSMMGAL